MKELDVIDYPDSLIDAINNFLRNPELITVFVLIVFQKTNTYDSNSVCATFNLVS
jgi:hypothetical protein